MILNVTKYLGLKDELKIYENVSIISRGAYDVWVTDLNKNSWQSQTKGTLCSESDNFPTEMGGGAFKFKQSEIPSSTIVIK